MLHFRPMMSKMHTIFFLKFRYLKRHCDISMNDYIVAFENLSHLVKNQNMKLPSKILAFKLLDEPRFLKIGNRCV